MFSKLLKRLFGKGHVPAAQAVRQVDAAPRPGAHRPVLDIQGKPLSRAAASTESDNDGFMVGLATGIPLPLTPMSIAGAALHDAMTAPAHDPGPSPSCSTDSTSYGSSYDRSSSSSSCDSGSSSSTSSSDSW